MTFKQFKQWCNDRACDGSWGHNDAVYCIELIQNMMKIPWWKRNKTWRKIETQVIYAVVTPINQKIKEVYGEREDNET